MKPEQQEQQKQFSGDALSDPEPAVPSLPYPDPGVFHRDLEPETSQQPEAERPSQ